METVRREPGAPPAARGQPVTVQGPYRGMSALVTPQEEPRPGIAWEDKPDPALPRVMNHAGARAEPIFAPSREELDLERIFYN